MKDLAEIGSAKKVNPFVNAYKPYVIFRISVFKWRIKRHICNADMRVGEVRQFCKLQEEGQSLMRAAMTQLNLFARAYHHILKLARTIADLAGSDEIRSPHLAETLQYRPKLMM